MITVIIVRIEIVESQIACVRALETRRSMPDLQIPPD